jgi:hypothetical protein
MLLAGWLVGWLAGWLASTHDVENQLNQLHLQFSKHDEKPCCARAQLSNTTTVQMFPDVFRKIVKPFRCFSWIISMEHRTTQCNTARRNATQHNTTQYNTTQHNTTLFQGLPTNSLISPQ